MNHRWQRTILTLAVLAWTVSAAMGYEFFEQPTQGEMRHGFRVDNLYLDADDKAVGSRLVHRNTGFTLDLFQIQSVPQGLIWVRTPSTSDMGEPHTLEHLLLGKGIKGQYVASLEDVWLARSTAYTSQLYTAYFFSSSGGNDIFFDILEAKLDALLHPNYSDEEIRREVCNVGVAANAADGAMRLEEKGTVYTEMISYYERYWYQMNGELMGMIYGPNHPLANVSGGNPDSIRLMTPDDLRAFHRRSYQLDNMGMIATAPAAIAPDEFLTRFDRILHAIDSAGIHPDMEPKTLELPAFQPTAAPGEMRLVEYPGSSEQEPGHVMLSWPPGLDLDSKDILLLNTFLNGLAGDQTSNLYNKFINSATRVRDLGASSVWYSVEDEAGCAAKIGLSDVNVDLVTKETLTDVARLIRDEVAAIAAYGSDSPELEDFNLRARGYLKEKEKDLKNYLNTPPGFGNRGGGGGRWYGHLKTLERAPGFQKSLLQEDEMAYALMLLDQPGNIWSDLIAEWKLAETPLCGVGARANPTLLVRAGEEKDRRLAAFTQRLKTKYGAADEQGAIAKYKAEYDRNTEVIDSIAATIAMPKFLDRPPLTYDPELDYMIDTLAGVVPLVASTFNTMTSATVGIALKMDVLPEDKLMYIPFLPDLITEIGAVKDGHAIDYAAMTRRLQEEILSLRAYLSANPYTGRVELMVRGAGGDIEESRRALEWMTAGLFSPYLSPENLPRIRDVVKNRIARLRDRMKGSEEGWVETPADAYKYQTNHLLLAGNCFLTQQHLMQRVKWQLMGIPSGDAAKECLHMFDLLAAAGEGAAKNDLVTFASAFGGSDTVVAVTGHFAEFLAAYKAASDQPKNILREAMADLAGIIADSPDENAVGDWVYLARQMKKDLQVKPEETLKELAETLALLRNRNTARAFMVSSETSRQALMPAVNDLVARLDEAQPIVYNHTGNPVILDRMRSRYPAGDKPTYVGLISTGTRNGVFVYSHPCAGLRDRDEDKLLDYLTLKLYGGGGAHSIFMKTWSAGLAYSNGFRCSEATGYLTYYAERCPDLATTMRFVVDELEKAPYEPALIEYAVAQVFAYNRAPNSYETRGEAQASFLADGITDDLVTRFRRRMLELREKPNLYDLLRARMKEAYGPVVIGYDEKLGAYPEGRYFIVGPEDQFGRLEDYIASVEGRQTIYRLYPRDFWMVE